jgi:hypothetical protein
MTVEKRRNNQARVILITLVIGFCIGLVAQLVERGLATVLPADFVDVISSATSTALVFASIPAFIVASEHTRVFELPLLSRFRV